MNKSYLLILFLLCPVLVSLGQTQTGKASFYADKFEGHPTASGEKYKHNKLTAAHKTLPFGTVVRVTNLANGSTVEVKINDRGPYIEGRVIDLSKSAAEKLGFINLGVTDVKLEVVDAGDGKSKSQPVSIDNVSVDENEYYDFEVTGFKPKGFGVQIGTYQELVNLLRLTENLKDSYKKNVTVQVKILNGVKFYSLIIGPFPNRAKAESFHSEVKSKYSGSFIVDFSKL
jgi:rare lipoprotein A